MSFRDSVDALLGTRRERAKILKEIVALEYEELGVPPQQDIRRSTPSLQSQQAHIAKISRPKSVPPKIFRDFPRAPRSLRGRGIRSPDDLFSAASSEDPNGFWLYDLQKVTQSTLGSLGNKTGVTRDEIAVSSVWQAVKRKVDALMAVAATKERCGLLFDIISTSKIINNGIPHTVGKMVYEYVAKHHHDKTSLKFIFVGITDNVNCCAARDVFCRNEILNNKYVGDTKRTFDRLDNLHMFCVYPGDAQNDEVGFTRNTQGTHLPQLPPTYPTKQQQQQQRSPKSHHSKTFLTQS